MTVGALTSSLISYCDCCSSHFPGLLLQSGAALRSPHNPRLCHISPAERQKRCPAMHNIQYKLLNIQISFSAAHMLHCKSSLTVWIRSPPVSTVSSWLEHRKAEIRRDCLTYFFKVNYSFLSVTRQVLTTAFIMSSSLLLLLSSQSGTSSTCPSPFCVHSSLHPFPSLSPLKSFSEEEYTAELEAAQDSLFAGNGETTVFARTESAATLASGPSGADL